MIAAAFETVEETGTSRRRQARRRLRLNVPSRIEGAEDQQVIVHDISANGLLIESRTQLDPGEPITVELPEAPASLSRVVWRSGNYYGCEFDKPIPSAAISAALLQSPIERPQARAIAEQGAAAATAAAVSAAQAMPEQPEAEEEAVEDLDRIERGALPSGLKIQLVVAISVLLWVALFKLLGLF